MPKMPGGELMKVCSIECLRSKSERIFYLRSELERMFLMPPTIIPRKISFMWGMFVKFLRIVISGIIGLAYKTSIVIGRGVLCPECWRTTCLMILDIDESIVNTNWLIESWEMNWVHGMKMLLDKWRLIGNLVYRLKLRDMAIEIGVRSEKRSRP